MHVKFKPIHVNYETMHQACNICQQSWEQHTQTGNHHIMHGMDIHVYYTCTT